MKVGDYVRISNGQIAKIVKIKEYKKCPNIIYTDITIDMHEDRCCNENFIDQEYIIKSSPNIIDLIEVGDFIGKIFVEEIREFNDGTRVIVMADGFDEYEENEDFLRAGIVTKEHFESMEYKVVE